ncbi:FAD-binding oxidoreductase [Shinella zoogloeoides]|uniref:NAD(P)/FAD-dependent oxidoreductase n=1 Tax=Shinella zoogloeoides TaxID=352475 RepID=UPI0028B00781|nr:FAD-binding oxidoreductase [Shinella zoogloeoides]
MPASKTSYDVVIVGGAVVGSATAYFLATNPDFTGSVLVIEKDWTYQRSATALSSSSIRHQFSNAINVQVSQFGTEFIRNFKENVAVDDDTPEIGFHENGYLFLAGDERGADVLRRNHETQVSCGAEVSLLDPEGLATRFPWLNTDGLTLGSKGERGEGWFDSVGLLQGFRKKARSLGVEYIEDEVVAIDREGDRVVSVTTKGGQVIACGTLVNTSGTNGKVMARMAGLDIPVEPRRRSLFVVDCREPLGPGVGLTIDPTGVFFRPEGKFYLMGTYPKHDPEVDPNDFAVMHDEFEEEIWPTLAGRVPAFEAIKVVNSWAGHYDYCTLDHNVILGPHTEVKNFLFANGFSGHGLQQSPAMGRGLSELIAYGGFRTLDLAPFGYERVAANRPFLEDAVI